MESDGFGDSELIFFFSKGQGGGVEEGGGRREVGGWGKSCFAQLRCFCH